MAAINYIKQLQNRISSELDYLDNFVFNKSSLLDKPITSKDIFLNCFRKIKSYLLTQHSLRIEKIRSRQTWEQYQLITFRKGYNEEHNQYLIMLAQPSYVVPELKYNEKFDSNVISYLIDNCCLTAMLNPSYKLSESYQWLIIIMYLFYFCNQHMKGNVRYFTVRELIVLCLNNYFSRKYDLQTLNNDVMNTNIKNIEYAYHHSDVVTIGKATQAEKHIATNKAKNELRDKFVVERLQAGTYSYRDIVKEYKEQFNMPLSTREINNVKKKYLVQVCGDGEVSVDKLLTKTVSVCSKDISSPQTETV